MKKSLALFCVAAFLVFALTAVGAATPPKAKTDTGIVKVQKTTVEAPAPDFSVQHVAVAQCAEQIPVTRSEVRTYPIGFTDTDKTVRAESPPIEITKPPELSRVATDRPRIVMLL